MAFLVQILMQVGKALLMSLLTERFIKELVVHFLEFLAKKTDNEVDDELVRAVKSALQPQKSSEEDTKTE